MTPADRRQQWLASMSSEHASFVRWFESSGGTIGTASGSTDRGDASGSAAGEEPLWTLHDYSAEGMGTGLRATVDMPENSLLFTIDRKMLLNTRNSRLPTILQEAESSDMDDGSIPRWEHLSQKWAGLILSMLWEQRRARHGSGNSANGLQWGPYLDVLPRNFSTPMFWPKEDVELLQGTSIASKIGREEADEDYYRLILPLVKGRPGLFLLDASSPSALEDGVEESYSLAQFHVMGSRILSRSFHVEEWDEKKHGEKPEGQADGDDAAEGDGDDDSDDGEEEGGNEKVEDISMVPMADMLNARPGEYHNARLFYLPTQLEMRTTRAVRAGEQIYNTYADPPNSDLLRRYGHVDLHASFSDAEGSADVRADALDNPNDNVELSWDLVARAAVTLKGKARTDAERAQELAALKARIAAFESLGVMPDECAVLEHVPPLPAGGPEPKAAMRFLEDRELEYDLSELWAACKLVWADEAAYEKYHRKAEEGEELEAEWRTTLKDKALEEQLQQPEKSATSDNDSEGPQARVLCARLALEAVRLRLAEYPTTLAEDEAAYASLLAEHAAVSPSRALEGSALNRHNALVVRIGEKRILARLAQLLEAGCKAHAAKAGATERAAPAASERPAKKART